MIKYFVQRLLSGLFTLFIILTLVFFMMRLIGGNPVYSLIDTSTATIEEIQEMTHEMGFDKPLVVQYALYLQDIFHGEWGKSYFNYKGVFENMLNRWEPTLMIAGCSLVLMICIGIPVGVISATHRNSLLDYTMSSSTLIMQTVPAFWLGLLMIFYLAFKQKLFPLNGYKKIADVGFWKSVYYVAMPSMALAASSIGQVARQTRSSFLGVMKNDYIRTARAKGLSQLKTQYVHALKNAISLITSIITSQVATLLGGSVVIEKVFGIEGIGKLALDSLNRRDYSQEQACVLACAAIYVAINILQDVIYKLIDPRVDFS